MDGFQKWDSPAHTMVGHATTTTGTGTEHRCVGKITHETFIPTTSPITNANATANTNTIPYQPTMPTQEYQLGNKRPSSIHPSSTSSFHIIIPIVLILHRPKPKAPDERLTVRLSCCFLDGNLCGYFCSGFVSWNDYERTFDAAEICLGGCEIGGFELELLDWIESLFVDRFLVFVKKRTCHFRASYVDKKVNGLQ